MALFSRSSSPNPRPFDTATAPGSPGNPRPKHRVITVKLVMWFVLIAVVGVVAWIGISGALAIKSIVATNNNDGEPKAVLHASLKPADVQTEGDSRINILLAGIGGPGHAGPDLTDTLEVYSIDPVNKTAAVLSIPRDLYVTLPDGSKSKINAVNTQGTVYCKKHTCAAGVDPGGTAMEATIGDLLGIKISYFVRINFQGFQQLVDTLGGVQINVTERLDDPFYPDDKTFGYAPLHIKAGLQTMNGATALKFARSRETSSDFQRAKRQQQVIAAIRDKALTAGILANPAKITQILNVLGKNIKTDIQPSDLSTLIGLVKDINSDATTTFVLDTAPTSPLTSVSDPRAGYIIYPRKGLSDFSEVKLFVDGALKDPYVTKEAATIAIVNASGKPATGTSVQTILKTLGYNVISLTTATEVQTSSTVTNNSRKPYSTTLLQKRLGAGFTKAVTGQTADIVVTVGSRYTAK